MKASGRELPILRACSTSGIILGKKMPKYNATLRTIAIAPTTSTTFGLLSFSPKPFT